MLGKSLKLRFVASTEVAHRRVDAAAPSRDLHVIIAGGAQFLLLVARPSEDGVGVRVDQTRRENTSATIDLSRADEPLPKLAERSNGGDRLAGNGDGDIDTHSDVAHLAA